MPTSGLAICTERFNQNDLAFQRLLGASSTESSIKLTSILLMTSLFPIQRVCRRCMWWEM